MNSTQRSLKEGPKDNLFVDNEPDPINDLDNSAASPNNSSIMK